MIFWIDVALRLVGFGSCWYLVVFIACGGSPYRKASRGIRRRLR